ncbi:type II restriction endonuclease [Paenibacillus sp. FSL R5-0345]|uniref:type II restriction endonuclease n=1 Tax=Paenibacillus sp. FSL R5-0345 TaxID=1536770 RepID=UPI0012E08A26|nr:type II restriction endonuclease [Paenibacillus sp. FSL R5-0345]
MERKDKRIKRLFACGLGVKIKYYAARLLHNSKEETIMFKFIDLFAGIGGIRIAFEKQGGKCVFSSEWDQKAQETYEANFGYRPVGDIRDVSSEQIPDHDILLAGFPCQPFSLAGVSKKNSLGRSHGFADETQGTLFFEIARIIRAKRPKAFLLENVKNLRSHDDNKTFRTIMRVLQKELGYKVYDAILDAKGLVPQHRERIYLVGFLDPIAFEFPTLPEQGPPVSSILEQQVDEKYTLTDNLWKYLQSYAEKHQKAGNGFGYGLVDFNSSTRTLSARYYKDGSEILIPQKGQNPRRLTPRECARLQGFPENYRIVVSDAAAYKQFGNSVAVPVVEKIAECMIKALKAKKVVDSYNRSKYFYDNNRDEAIARASQYGQFFYKFISANDIGKTGSHQSGIYIPKDSWSILFDKPGEKEVNKERAVRIYWEQLDLHSDSMFKWYGKKSRSEYRITRFGKKFPLFSDSYLGDLLIFIKVNSDEYLGYVLSGKDADSFLETFSISPTENVGNYGLIDNIEKSDLGLSDKLNEGLVNSVSNKMLTPRQISQKAQNLYFNSNSLVDMEIDNTNVDALLLELIELEYMITKSLEKSIYQDKLQKPFNDLELLLEFASTAAQTRQLRTELTFQFHLDFIFKQSKLNYEFQVVTSKKRGFRFISNNNEKVNLLSLVTCKENWRDYLNPEGPPLFIVTLEKGMSAKTLEDMELSNVSLVVPNKYLSFYPIEYRSKILSLSNFCGLMDTKKKEL